MKSLKIIASATLLCVVLISCDSNHQSEFYRIQRDDITGYQEFIRKYPKSAYVKDAKERIETATEEIRMKEEQERRDAELRQLEEKRMKEEQERKDAELRRIESQWGNNSLSNGAAPYSRWYGNNLYFDDYTPHSEIQVTAPYNSDVIAIVRYNNMNGRVAGHRYIKAGMTSKIYLSNGYNYQTFFYYGKGWYPNKEMKNVKGGFVKGESYSKDGAPTYLQDNILSYELTLQEYGNFQTASSNEGEMF